MAFLMPPVAFPVEIADGAIVPGEHAWFLDRLRLEVYRVGPVLLAYRGDFQTNWLGVGGTEPLYDALLLYRERDAALERLGDVRRDAEDRLRTETLRLYPRLATPESPSPV